LIRSNKQKICHPYCSDDLGQLGSQDYIVLTVKATALLDVAKQIEPFLISNVAIVSVLNGIPWWYFYKKVGPYENIHLKSVDPDGELWRLLPPERVIGCVVYPAVEVIAPGKVVHNYGDRFSLGELDGSRSERVLKLARTLTAAGFRAPIRLKIHDELWTKLLGNLAFNAVSALTTATMDVIVNDLETRALCRTMMLEAMSVAKRLGVHCLIDADQRLEKAKAVGVHKTSMLQDLEHGRPMEVNVLLRSVIEIASIVGVQTPVCTAVLALLQQRAFLAGCLPK
jgi:2-dehydropantoate 2-reductase